MTCLLQLNDLENAVLIIGSIWGDEKLDLTIHKDLMQTLFALIEIMIGKMCEGLQCNKSTWSQNKLKQTKKNLNILSSENGICQCENAEQLHINLAKIIKILGVHIGYNPRVFLQLLKVCNNFLMQSD